MSGSQIFSQRMFVVICFPIYNDRLHTEDKAHLYFCEENIGETLPDSICAIFFLCPKCQKNRIMHPTIEFDFLLFTDLLWTLLCGYQPIQEIPNLHPGGHRFLQGQEKERDPSSYLLCGWQRLLWHVDGSWKPVHSHYVSLGQQCVSFVLVFLSLIYGINRLCNCPLIHSQTEIAGIMLPDSKGIWYRICIYFDFTIWNVHFSQYAVIDTAMSCSTAVCHGLVLTRGKRNSSVSQRKVI